MAGFNFFGNMKDAPIAKSLPQYPGDDRSEIFKDAQRQARKPIRKAILRGQAQQDERDTQSILSTAKEGMDAESAAERQIKIAKAKAGAKALQSSAARYGAANVKRVDANAQAFAKGRNQAIDEFAAARAIAQRQNVDFSVQQDQLREMFGHGDKIWSVNNEPVRINNDLHPSLNNNPYEEQTSDMFGFGGRGERSGMF